MRGPVPGTGRMPVAAHDHRAIWSWALYDWANSAFSLAVITVFVPVLLGGLWNDGAESTVTTFRLGLGNGVASIVVVFLAPVLGAITDQARRRKPGLVVLTGLGIGATAAMAGLGAGDWPAALVLYVVASVGFFGANALYDALLMDVAPARDYDRVSALGYAIGYLGGALAFAICVAMVAAPARFGLADDTAAAQASFLLVAAWWALFTVPLVLWVRERGAALAAPGRAALAGFRQLASTLRALRGQRNLLLFLAAYWLYIDGVYTIIKMAVDFGLSQGLSTRDVTGAILLTNFIGFPAAIAFGRVGERYGPRAGIFITLAVYIVATTAAVFLETAWQFYLLAAAIGCVQGGVQSLSRSLYARLVPMDERGEYFGFYNMLGKFSSILGPVMAGTAALLTGSQRFGILSILVLFLAGAFLLTQVRVPAPEASRPAD